MQAALRRIWVCVIAAGMAQELIASVVTTRNAEDLGRETVDHLISEYLSESADPDRQEFLDLSSPS